MGGSNSHSFGSHDWQFIRRAGNTSNFDIVRDKRTGITAQKHTIPNNPTMSEEDQMQAYHYRNLTNKPIVKVYDAQYVKGKGGGACGAAKDIAVFSQYIPYRLSDLKNLNHGQGLYVLSQALRGFNELYHRFGAFQVTDDHIGFNEIGETKVWHSPNFATNHLNRDNIILMSTANPHQFDQRIQQTLQHQMVEDIWRAVDNHTNFTPEFMNNARDFQGRNFQQAHRLVTGQISRNNTYVPDFLTFMPQYQTLPGLANSQASNIQPNQQFPQNQYNSGNTNPQVYQTQIQQGNQPNQLTYQTQYNPGNQPNPQIYQTHQISQNSQPYPIGQQVPAYNSTIQSNINQNYNPQVTYQSQVTGYQNSPQRNQVQSNVVGYNRDNVY